MQRELVEERIRSLLVSRFFISRDLIVATASLVDILGMDSLDRLELLMQIEKEFDIEFPDEIAKNITDFSSLVDLVTKNTEGK